MRWSAHCLVRMTCRPNASPPLPRNCSRVSRRPPTTPARAERDRALDYLAVRYPELSGNAAEQFARDATLTSVTTQRSRLGAARHIVEVVFTYTNRVADVAGSWFARVDVTEQFPFLMTKLSPCVARMPPACPSSPQTRDRLSSLLAACSGTLTLRHTFAIRPALPIRNVRAPFPYTPPVHGLLDPGGEGLGTLPSASEASGKVSSYFAANFSSAPSCRAHPDTSMPSLPTAAALPGRRRPPWCSRACRPSGRSTSRNGLPAQPAGDRPAAGGPHRRKRRRRASGPAHP